MLTAIVSDLHVGTTSGADVARRPDVQERLFAALAEADRVVVLGDMLELREQPAPAVFEAAGPFLDGLGEATADKELVIVPGNHDYELVAPALHAERLHRRGPLPLEGTFSPDEGPLAREVAGRMPRTEVVLAYPGIRLREDVHATHGHYLDVHLTVPRLECVIASAVGRLAGPPGDGPPSTDRYEAALAPIYGFAFGVVQSSAPRAVTRGGNLSRMVWSRSNPRAGQGLAGLAIGRLALPAGVSAINRLGLGPFRADISGLELRRAGLRAMGQVAGSLGIEADHVIFGHTHRPGPLDGEVEGWWMPGGSRLTNTGSWLYERVFMRDGDPDNPYWPGRLTLLRDHGPPEVTGLLDDLDLSEVHAATAVPG